MTSEVWSLFCSIPKMPNLVQKSILREPRISSSWGSKDASARNLVQTSHPSEGFTTNHQRCGGMVLGIGQVSTGKPTKQVENGFSGLG